LPHEAMDKAVILARGLGTRMRKDDPGAALTAEQSAAANVGVKALIPIGRPFLDYLLSALAEAGYRRVCLVIGPEHREVRQYVQGLTTRRLSIAFAVQEKPLGTADAVAAAEGFAADDPFLVINSDNYYPIDAMAALRGLDTAGLIGFEREGLTEGGNIPPERIARFAVIRSSPDGLLEDIVEKPSAEVLARFREPICMSMNCWRLGPTIFPACRAIPPSPRGELELPDAVRYSAKVLGQRYRVLVFHRPVLDLSSRGDIASVAGKLKDLEVNL